MRVPRGVDGDGDEPRASAAPPEADPGERVAAAAQGGERGPRRRRGVGGWCGPVARDGAGRVLGGRRREARVGVSWEIVLRDAPRAHGALPEPTRRGGEATLPRRRARCGTRAAFHRGTRACDRRRAHPRLGGRGGTRRGDVGLGAGVGVSSFPRARRDIPPREFRRAFRQIRELARVVLPPRGWFPRLAARVLTPPPREFPRRPGSFASTHASRDGEQDERSRVERGGVPRVRAVPVVRDRSDAGAVPLIISASEAMPVRAPPVASVPSSADPRTHPHPSPVSSRASPPAPWTRAGPPPSPRTSSPRRPRAARPRPRRSS